MSLLLDRLEDEDANDYITLHHIAVMREECGVSAEDLGVTSCPPSRNPYTRDVTIFYISTLSMLFDICGQSCWQSCVTPIVEHHAP